MDNEQKRAELRQKRANLREIYAKIEKSSDLAEMRSLDDQAAKLRAEVYNIEDSLDGADPEVRSPGPIGATAILGTYGVATAGGTVGGSERSNTVMDKEMIERYEQRAADLQAGRPVTFGLDEIGFGAEQRTLTLAGGTVVAPKHVSPMLAPGFEQVSAVVDLVDSPVLMGGESFAKGFSKGLADAADYTTTEGEDYTDVEPEHDIIETGKTLITSYGEISNQVLKLSPIDYNSEMIKAMRTALRMKLSREIIIGDGGSGHLTGIYNAPAKVIPVETDLPYVEVDEGLLDVLVFGYGGFEALEGNLWLILNRADLAAFAKLRSSDGAKKLYKITVDDGGQTGTISSEDSFQVRWVINSACKALSDVSTGAGAYTMVFGRPLGYCMPQFSQLTVEVAREFKFKQGLVAYRGEAYMGGVPAAWKVFTRVKKVAGV